MLDMPETDLERLPSLVDRASDLSRGARAEATRNAYTSDWADFAGWCFSHHLDPLPAEPRTVALYLADRSTLKPATLTRRLATISKAHKVEGHGSPTGTEPVKAVIAGIRREKGTAQKVARPLLVPDLERVATSLGDRLRDDRDRALILLGFSGAFRRSELSALDWSDIEATKEGLTVTIRRSKTDQEGAGRKVGIPYGRRAAQCPVRAVNTWRTGAGEIGPVFLQIDRHGNLGGRLSADAINDIVKRVVLASGGDPKGISAHSLRAGLATAAAMAGVSERVIMKQTGHRSAEMVRRYIRDGTLFTDNAASKTGL